MPGQVLDVGALFSSSVKSGALILRLSDGSQMRWGMGMMLPNANYKIFVQRSDEEFLLEVSAKSRTFEKFLADLADSFICPEV